MVSPQRQTRDADADLLHVPVEVNAMRNLTSSSTLAILFLTAVTYLDVTAAAPRLYAADIDYLRDIKPILKSKCFSCHGAIKQEAGLRLDTVSLMRKGGDSGPALSANNQLQSLLLQRVTSKDPDERMPPEGEPFSAEQLERLRSWLAAGAPSPKDEIPRSNPKDHWAFQPLGRVQPPLPVKSRKLHPIDAFIDQRLKGSGLKRSEQADPVTLVRRMFLDLHGLPPTPSEVARWTTAIAQDATATNKLVDELLASPRYGERWAQHWLDIVRYADTHGFEVNTPRANAWPYRDYVINAINQDTPYNEFIRQQLAGDTLGEDAATGFMVAAAALLPGQIGADEPSKRLARQEELDEIIVGTTATFLGLTVGCARCHDHKFDPIPQSDYYAMQAFFAGVTYGDRPLNDAGLQKRLDQAAKLQPRVDELKRQLASYEPLAFTGRTIVIDDEETERVTLLKEKNGHGANPKGTGRGYANDVGTADRFSNLSRGRYTWWTNTPGEDVFTWNPNATGTYRLWVSWGVHGSGVHTRDARYVLDVDGDLTTKDDQKEVAQADQHYFAGQTTGESEMKPLWSGFLNAGVHEFQPTTRLILRGGDTKTGITADVIVLQEVADDVASKQASADQTPRLRGPVSALKNVERFEPVSAKFVRFTSFATTENNRYEPCIDELEIFTAGDDSRNVALASFGTKPTSSGNLSNSGQHQLKHINDGRYGNSFSWISNQHGKGWVQLEFPSSQRIDRIEWARDREGKFGDRLAMNYQISVSLDGQAWHVVASSNDRVAIGTPHDDVAAKLRSHARSNGDAADAANIDLPTLAKELQALSQQQTDLRKPLMVFAGKFRKPSQTFVLNRGDAEQRLDEIEPQTLSNFGSLALKADASDEDRRTALANWIASPENPLTARVIVNRIWQQHFGVGLVDTPSDFGLNGSEPTHPELLDWLAIEFIEHGWSLKYMHQLIMSSETYRQSSSQADSNGRTIDANNRLLWHFPSRRLEAEAIRDCMLAVSGQLNLKMGGPGFDFFKTRGGLTGFPPVEKFTTNELRRMIYAHKIRMEPVPVFGAFDCPDAGLPTPRRSQSTTAIQALNLLNSSFVLDQSNRLAERLTTTTNDADAQVNLAFQLAFGRQPSERERPIVLTSVKQHGLATLCRALFNTSEFLFIP